MSLRLTMPCFRSALAACALVALLCPSPASADTPAEHAGPNGAKVGELFDQAQAAFAKGDKQAAYKAYKEAWALQKSYDIAGNLGNVELKLGMYSGAAEHLDYALANFPPTGEPAAQQLLTKKRDEARNELGRVRVVVNVPGAHVFVDGKDVGAAPLAEPLYVSPAGCSIDAKLEGYADAHGAASPAKGSEKSVTLSLVPLERPKPRSLVPGVVLGGAAVVGLATGIGLLVAAGGKHSTVLELNNGILADKKSCAPGASNFDARCSALETAASSSDTLHNLGVGFLAGGGAAALGAGLYFLWPASKSTTGTGVRWIPVSTATGGGLVAAGTF
jgi:tetratricopeptide (TPR) repeat protein